jgi:hypothetical protein
LNPKVPKLRQGSYFPGFLEPRKTSEKALVAVIQEAWIGGVSIHRVDELAQAMGLQDMSKSTVSKLCKDIDERVPDPPPDRRVALCLARRNLSQGPPGRADRQRRGHNYWRMSHVGNTPSWLPRSGKLSTSPTEHRLGKPGAK